MATYYTKTKTFPWHNHLPSLNPDTHWSNLLRISLSMISSNTFLTKLLTFQKIHMRVKSEPTLEKHLSG